MTDKTLIKFIRDELAPAERWEVIRWIEASDENRRHYALIKARETVSEFNISRLDVDKSYREVIEKAGNNERRIPVWTRIAAAVLVLVASWFVWQLATDTSLPESDEINESYESMSVTGRGENTEVILPDGSSVLLNADSRLTWVGDFTDSLREVHLTGEAFFEVVRDTLRPFVVRTEEMDVKVLGTTFNVRAYPDDERPVTTLVSGSVEVAAKTHKTVRLEPMQTAVLDIDAEQFEIDDISESEAAPWRDGKLIFQDSPLEAVVRDIERKYDVECEVESPELKKFLFTGTFDNLSIDEVLRVLKISSDIDYTKDGRKIELY